MEKKRKRKIGMVILYAVLSLFIIFTVVFSHSIILTVKNLTARQIHISATDRWENGKVFLAIPYSEVSESDYLNLYVPDMELQKPKLLVLIHGGGFIAGTAETKQTQLMYLYFRDHGYACATINYRLAEEAGFPAAIEDCKSAIRYLCANADRYGYDAEQIVLFGESAGGYLATMCALTNDEEFNTLAFTGQTEENNPSARVDALIDYYPYTALTGLNEDLKEIGYSRLFYFVANSWMIGKLSGFEDFASCWLRKNITEMTPEERSLADPLYYLEKNAADLGSLTIYLIHGDADITVPIPSSNRLYEACCTALGEDSIQYRVVPGMGHASDPLYSDEVLAEIDEYLQKRLP